MIDGKKRQKITEAVLNTRHSFWTLLTRSFVMQWSEGPVFRPLFQQRFFKDIIIAKHVPHKRRDIQTEEVYSWPLLLNHGPHFSIQAQLRKDIYCWQDYGKIRHAHILMVGL